MYRPYTVAVHGYGVILSLLVANKRFSDKTTPPNISIGPLFEFVAE